MPLGPELDDARARVAEYGLTGEAIAGLTPIVRELPPESLAPVKQLLKRFFSDQPWDDNDDRALGVLMGPSGTHGRQELAHDLAVVWDWEATHFRLRVEGALGEPEADRNDHHRHDATREIDLAATFEGAVVPEATPSPRTIRFATPPPHRASSAVYDRASAAAHPVAGRIVADFDEVTNVLVGPDFVAVTIARPDRWEQLLEPVLRVVNEEFAESVDVDDVEEQKREAPMTVTLSVGAQSGEGAGKRRVDRAWAELGALRADQPEHLDRVLAASRDDEPERRQVAATLLADAPPEPAARAWERLLDDRSRIVRRSVVDAISGAAREQLRPLLERALTDTDAWVRWKALHGIAELGLGSSRDVVRACSTDTDFRVRLEATRILSASGTRS